MATLISLREAAARKGCSKQPIRRAVEAGKLNSEFDPVTGEYQVYNDEKLAQWQPGSSGIPPLPKEPLPKEPRPKGPQPKA